MTIQALRFGLGELLGMNLAVVEIVRWIIGTKMSVKRPKLILD